MRYDLLYHRATGLLVTHRPSPGVWSEREADSAGPFDLRQEVELPEPEVMALYPPPPFDHPEDDEAAEVPAVEPAPKAKRRKKVA